VRFIEPWYQIGHPPFLPPVDLTITPHPPLQSPAEQGFLAQGWQPPHPDAACLHENQKRAGWGLSSKHPILETT
jgi:hypothetical protein